MRLILVVIVVVIIGIVTVATENSGRRPCCQTQRLRFTYIFEFRHYGRRHLRQMARHSVMSVDIHNRQSFLDRLTPRFQFLDKGSGDKFSVAGGCQSCQMIIFDFIPLFFMEIRRPKRIGESEKTRGCIIRWFHFFPWPIAGPLTCGFILFTSSTFISELKIYISPKNLQQQSLVNLSPWPPPSHLLTSSGFFCRK